MAADPCCPSSRVAWSPKETEAGPAGAGRVVPWALAIGGALLALALLVACQSHQFKGTEYADPQTAPDFVLDNVQGGDFRLSEQKGKLVMMYFGYTSCPDICPATLAQAKQLYDRLGDQADQLVFLFITVDPERDTPEVIANYIGVFHPSIVGLTGDPADLQAVFADYDIVAEREELPDSAVGYVMNHTTRLFLVDADGRLRLSYSFGTPVDDVVADLEYLLGE